MPTVILPLIWSLELNVGLDAQPQCRRHLSPPLYTAQATPSFLTPLCLPRNRRPLHRNLRMQISCCWRERERRWERLSSRKHPSWKGAETMQKKAESALGCGLGRQLAWQWRVGEAVETSPSRSRLTSRPRMSLAWRNPRQSYICCLQAASASHSHLSQPHLTRKLLEHNVSL